MITAIDTNILLDVFLPDPDFGNTSMELLEKAFSRGALVICNVVYAELAPQFESKKLLDSTLEKMGIEVMLTNREASSRAGHYWKAYIEKVKKRSRIITDFLIGASAEVQADKFLTRDRGFYRSYFQNLQLY